MHQLKMIKKKKAQPWKQTLLVTIKEIQSLIDDINFLRLISNNIGRIRPIIELLRGKNSMSFSGKRSNKFLLKTLKLIYLNP